MLYAYVDETGMSAGHRAALVGGAIGAAEDWGALEPLWKQQLAADGIEEFHATKCRGGHGEYHVWRPDWDRMAKHYSDLADLAAKANLRPTAGSLVLKDWERLNARALKEELLSPYALCLQLCLYHIHGIAAALNQHVTVVYAMNDNQAKVAEALATVYVKSRQHMPRIVSCAPGRPKELAGLQVADMVAYEMYHTWHSSSKPSRPPLKLLPRMVSGHSTGVFYDFEGLTALAAAGAPEIT